jgi:hypothetical protein
VDYHGSHKIDIRNFFINDNGEEQHGKGIRLLVEEALTLHRALGDMLGVAAPTPRSKGPAVQHGGSAQDRALLALSEGWGPDDLQMRIYPEDPKAAKRVTELGKALRRCGMLVPKDWTLTDLGIARAESLKTCHGEMSGERL